MKNIRKYNKFKSIKESQSKKISQYIDFTTFLEWYNESRPKLADILDVDAKDLASEDEILKQSSDLINVIINRQSGGNSGRWGDTEIQGFKSFEPLTNKIAHDILHNIYNVTKKNFEGYNEYDFSESENIEEIEVLAIEESLMKYFKMDYIKSDFVHQNINRLVGFLMMAIIREDSDRIVAILDGEVEPYIEVYDKQYKTEGTPFENLFNVFFEIPIDPVRDKDNKIENGQDFKDWLGYMVLYGEAIDYEDSGDRANFPESGFLGAKEMWDLDDDESGTWMRERWHVYDIDELEGADLDDYSMNDRVAADSEIPKSIEDIYEEVEELNLGDLPKNVQTQFDDNSIVGDFITAYKVDDITHYGFFEEEVKWIIKGENSKYYDDTPIYIMFDADGDYNFSKTGLWDDVDLDDYLVGRDSLQESFWEDQWEFEKTVEDEINFSGHTDNLESNLRALKYHNDNAIAIARRYFRYNDVLVNNTKIDIESKKYTHIKDSLFDNYKSLSKGLTTDNAKRLVRIFDEFKGWTIKNFDMLKKRSKKMKSIFSKEDMQLIDALPPDRWGNTKLGKIQSDIYDNDLMQELMNDKPYIEVSTSKFRYNNPKQAIDLFKKYKDLFSRIDSKHIINYMKRIPNVKDTESITKHIDRFDDLFFDTFVDTYEKYKHIFDFSVEESDFKEGIIKDFDLKNDYLSQVRNIDLRAEDLPKFLDTIEKVVSNKIKGAKLINKDKYTFKIGDAHPNGSDPGYAQSLMSLDGKVDLEWIMYFPDKLIFRIPK